MSSQKITKIKRLNITQKNHTPLIKIENFRNTRSETFFLKNIHMTLDFNQFFEYCTPILVEKLKLLCKKSMLKFNIFVECTHENPLTLENRDIAFKTNNIVTYNNSKFTSLLNSLYNKILVEENQFITNGSGWSLKSIDGLLFRTNKLNVIGGATYIQLSKYIQSKEAVINVKNYDNQCFKYAILTKYDKQKTKILFLRPTLII